MKVIECKSWREVEHLNSIASDLGFLYCAVMTETLPHVNPHSEDFYQNPFPAYAMLRADAPVYEIPDQPGLFFVKRGRLFARH